jgi:hypothetical protein
MSEEVIGYIEEEFSNSTYFAVTKNQKYYNSAKEELPFILYSIYDKKAKLAPEGLDYKYRVASFAVFYYDFDLALAKCERPTIEICNITKDKFFSGTEIVQKIESIGKKLSCTSLFLNDKSTIDILSNNALVSVPLALLSICIDARTWYNKLGYYEKNYEEHYKYHSELIERLLYYLFNSFDSSYKIYTHYIGREFHCENSIVKRFLYRPIKEFFAYIKEGLRSGYVPSIVLDMIILLLNDANARGILKYSEYDDFVKKC